MLGLVRSLVLPALLAAALLVAAQQVPLASRLVSTLEAPEWPELEGEHTWGHLAQDGLLVISFEAQAPDDGGRVAVYRAEASVPEGLPEAFVVDNAWFRIEGAWQPTETGYGFAGSGSLKVPEVAPAEYEAFREALRSASSAASEGVVLVPAGP